MSEKKGFLSGLLGGKKSGGCCNMEIVEEGDANKQTSVCECACSSNEATETEDNCCCESTDGICCIKVLGTGCKSCHEQYENVKKAVSEIGLDIEVEYITDMEKVMTYGVMSMPAIVVNDKIASVGHVLKSGDVVKLLRSLGF